MIRGLVHERSDKEWEFRGNPRAEVNKLWVYKVKKEIKKGALLQAHFVAKVWGGVRTQ